MGRALLGFASPPLVVREPPAGDDSIMRALPREAYSRDTPLELDGPFGEPSGTGWPLAAEALATARPRPPRNWTRLTLMILGAALVVGLVLAQLFPGRRPEPAETAAEPVALPAPTPASRPVPAPRRSTPPPALAMTTTANLPAPAPKPAPPPARVTNVAADGPCPTGMLFMHRSHLCVDRDEANRAGRPITNVSLEEAAAACATEGKRLCSANDWERACRGQGGTSYPYGPSYRAERCHVRAGEGAAPDLVGSSSCVSASGALDMSGNVAEWDAEGNRRGGSASDGDDGRCSRRLRPPPGARAPDLGYRCCTNSL
jgi:hypothetical protein